MMILLCPLPSIAAGCKALKDETSYKAPYEKFKYLVEGQGGWIFRSKQDFRMKFAVDDDTWSLLTEVKNAFKKRNIDLVIAIPPTRGMAAASMVPTGQNGFDGVKATYLYKQFLEQAHKRKINIVGTPDIKTGLGYFYKGDHHWTSNGAREMALEVASTIKTLPVYKTLKKDAFKTVAVGHRNIKPSFNAPVQSICGEPLEDLSDTAYITTLKNTGTSEEAFFGDAPSPQIALIGTSNSKRETLDMNFEGFLKENLSVDIYNAALAGAGIEDPFFAYLDSQHYRSGNVRIIVWEIPGYYNLSSDRSKALLRQILAVLQGNCKNPVAQSHDNPVRAENTSFLHEKINLKDSYFVFEFNKPVNIAGFLTLQIGDHQYETYKFKRSKKYPANKLYFYKPAYIGSDLLENATLKFPSSDPDLTFTAKLCRYD